MDSAVCPLRFHRGTFFLQKFRYFYLKNLSLLSFRENGHVRRKAGSGRPPLLSFSQSKDLVALATQNGFLNAQQMKVMKRLPVRTITVD